MYERRTSFLTEQGLCADYSPVQKASPTCAVCRSKLSLDAPMIPNFAMDHTVEKHIQVLSISDASEWGKEGKLFLDWESRRRYVRVLDRNPRCANGRIHLFSRWKKQVQERETKSKEVSGSPRGIEVRPDDSGDRVQEVTLAGEGNDHGASSSGHNPSSPANHRERSNRRRHSRRSRNHQNTNGQGHGGNSPSSGGRSRHGRGHRR